MVHDPATDEAQQEIEDTIDDAVMAITLGILAIVVKRLGSLEGKTWAEIYAAMPQDQSAIDQIILKGQKDLENKVQKAFENAAESNDKWAEKFYNAAEKMQRKYNEDFDILPIYESKLKSAISDVKKFTANNAIGIGTDPKVWQPARDAYREVVAKGATEIITGAKTQDQVLKESVHKLCQYGTKVQYAKKTYPLYSALRMNIMATYREAIVEMREQQGIDYGADGVEVTMHVPCAIDHLPYQGKHWTFEQWKNIQSDLSRQLVYGANCHHMAYPIKIGVAINPYSGKQRAEAAKMSEENVTFTGLSGKQLTMTRYDASQYQRKVERQIRETNMEIYLNGNAELQQTAKAYTSAYRTMSKQMGLPALVNRTKI